MKNDNAKRKIIETVWEVSERSCDDIIEQILINRHISHKDKEQFIKPDFDRDLADPYLLPDMQGAVRRIKKAAEKKEKIGIFADYDADGTPGAALLTRAFRQIGLESEVFIPSRQDDGYGLNYKGIDYLIDRGCSLVITVDLGIRSLTEAAYCSENSIDLIITDHHLPGDAVPKALFVINPKISKNNSPLYDLCGCGVVYKLIEALSKEFKQINEHFLKWNLDLVAISTISDVVPLTGENRIFAKYGLIVLRRTKNLGLKYLIKAAGIDPSKINPYAVGFQIGPRINTPGRIDHATKAFELLIAKDPKEAEKIAGDINEMNKVRQAEMDKVYDDAVEMINKNQLFENKIIIVDGKWPRGVLGPPASRLVEKYCRPAIVLAREEDDYTGSARSINGVHILELLEKVAPTLKKYGGHKGAAGIAVDKDKYEKFRLVITKIANQEITDDNLVKKIKIDALSEAKDLTKTLYNEIDKLEPFGLGNPRPVLMMEKVLFENIRRVGIDGKHLSAFIMQNGRSHKSIFFNCDQTNLCIHSNTMYDIVFNLNLDSWNRQEQLSLNIIDVRESDA